MLADNSMFKNPVTFLFLFNKKTKKLNIILPSLFLGLLQHAEI